MAQRPVDGGRSIVARDDRPDVPASDDPSVVRAITVTTDDVVTAVEARRNGRPAVLRLTPPFSGRMRARLHVDKSGHGTDSKPVHVDPRDLLAEDAPTYPEPAETEDALRADPEERYSTERHRERHVEAVELWRESVRHWLVDETTIETADGPRTVEVRALG